MIYEDCSDFARYLPQYRFVEFEQISISSVSQVSPMNLNRAISYHAFPENYQVFHIPTEVTPPENKEHNVSLSGFFQGTNPDLRHGQEISNCLSH